MHATVFIIDAALLYLVKIRQYILVCNGFGECVNVYASCSTKRCPKRMAQAILEMKANRPSLADHLYVHASPLIHLLSESIS